MAQYTVKEVVSRRDLKRFITFVDDLYKGCDMFVPPLHKGQERDLMHSPSLQYCSRKMWIAEDADGKVVGRICAMINPRYNEKYDKKRVRFGWFDLVNDIEVARLLMGAAEAWAKENGMEEIHGPLFYNTLGRQGMLVEGFDKLPPFSCLYNYPYYVQHMEAYGLAKENDWIEMQIYPPKDIPERFGRMAKIVQERSHVRVDKVKNVKELVKKYGTSYMDVIDICYQKLYNFQPLTERQKRHYCDMYFPLLNFDFVTIVVNEKDEVVGLGVGMPDISKALRKTKGKLFPFGWYHLLKALKSDSYDTFDFLIIAIRPDYQDKGLNAVIIADQHPYFVKYGIKTIETTAIMETNFKNLNHWEMFPHKYHKRRRAYVKSI